MAPLLSIKFSYQKTLSFLGLITGILLAISSESSFGIWFGLELNMISFICYIMLGQHHSTTSEVMLKYFLIQSPTSFIFLLAFVFFQMKGAFTGVLLAMLIKMGAAPFHFWLPQISESLNWDQLLLMFSSQKVAPLAIMSLTYKFQATLLMVSVVISAFVGSIGGLNETSMRKILAFSSISHLSWILSCLLVSSLEGFIYFLIYILILISLLSALKTTHISQLSHIWSSNMNTHKQLSIMVPMLSLMGLPPLFGFAPKLLVILLLSSFNMIFLLIPVLISSSISLYYYLRLTLTLLHLKKQVNPYFLSKNQPPYPISMMVNIMGIFGVLPILMFL